MGVQQRVHRVFEGVSKGVRRVFKGGFKGCSKGIRSSFKLGSKGVRNGCEGASRGVSRKGCSMWFRRWFKGDSNVNSKRGFKGCSTTGSKGVQRCFEGCSKGVQRWIQRWLKRCPQQLQIGFKGDSKWVRRGFARRVAQKGVHCGFEGGSKVSQL